MELVHKKNKREKDMYARVQEGKWGVDEGVDGGGEAGAAEDEDGFEASVPHLPQFIKWFIRSFLIYSHLHLPSIPALTHS